MKNKETLEEVTQMNQTAVEWLEQEIFRRYKFTFQQINCQPLEEAIEQAKEMHKQEQDEFAIGFAEWTSYKYKYLETKGWFGNSYDLEMGIFKSSKQLLEIYKTEKGL